MKVRAWLLAVLVSAPLVAAEAQSCMGGFAMPAGVKRFYAAGTYETSEFADGTGVRFGYLDNGDKLPPAAVYGGIRSIGASGVSQSFLDLQGIIGLSTKKPLLKAMCFVAGMDVSLSSEANAFNDTYFGLSIGGASTNGFLTTVPFAMLGFINREVPDAQISDYATMFEYGAGFRFGEKLTVTISSRSLMWDTVENTSRVAIGFPFGNR